jgi:DNA mismatch endonuclease (patch repair protein)
VRADLVFPRKKIAVFVDGCFWHACAIHGISPQANRGYWGPKLARNQERDRRVDARLAAGGWKVVRIWEHLGVGEAADLVLEAIRQAIKGLDRTSVP